MMKSVLDVESFLKKGDQFLRVFFFLYLASLVTSMSGMELFSSLVAVGTLVLLFIRKPQHVQVPPFVFPMAVFVLIILAGVLVNDTDWPEKFQDARQVRFFVLYVLLFYYFRNYGRIPPTLQFLSIICLAVGVYGFFQHFMPLDLLRPEEKKIILFALEDQKIGPLVLGTFNHHLTFSNIFLFYACLFFSVGLSGLKGKWPFFFLGILLYLLCLWTQSRAAWVAIPVTVLVITLGRNRKTVIVSLVVIGILAVGFYALDEGFRGRFNKTLFEKNDLYNLGPRTRLWKANWEMFKEHPFLGIGYNNNERQVRRYMDRLFPDRTDRFLGHSHSTPLQILSTTGILGFIAYCFLWGLIFLRCARVVRRCGREELTRWIGLGSMAAFIGFHIQGLTQWNFGDAEVLHNVIFFWVVVAILDFPRSLSEMGKF